MSGVANPLIPASRFDTPLTYEDMTAIGTGLGAAGFIVFDDEADLAAVAAGVSRFLAVESCGQCTPCKDDGLAIASMLAKVCDGDANEYDLAGIADRVATVADEARCFLAEQHQRVIDSVLRLFPDSLRNRLVPGVPAVRPEPILPIRDLADDGRFELELEQLDKQPDWSFDAVDSGKRPVERLAEGGTQR
jgi:NADH:ubiquinone oxidoreductase subunit F (NADH-binding)